MHTMTAKVIESLKKRFFKAIKEQNLDLIERMVNEEKVDCSIKREGKNVAIKIYGDDHENLLLAIETGDRHFDPVFDDIVGDFFFRRHVESSAIERAFDSYMPGEKVTFCPDCMEPLLKNSIQFYRGKHDKCTFVDRSEEELFLLDTRLFNAQELFQANPEQHLNCLIETGIGLVR